MPSLCETCALMREIITPKGSRFLLCQLSTTDPAYPKYPPQPVVRCDGYRPKDKPEEGEFLIVPRGVEQRQRAK